MLTKRTVLKAAAFSAVFSSAKGAAADSSVDGVPLPADASIVPPSPGGSPFAQLFSGVWTGAWGGVLKHILLVESIATDGTCTVVYGWGENPRIGLKSGWLRQPARIIDRTLTIDGNFKATYWLGNDRFLAARWQRGDARAAAGMGKAEDTVLTQRITPTWGVGESVMLDTSLREAGKAVRLEAMIYTPSGPGPFSLLLCNHGSTGNGTNKALFGVTHHNSILARYFLGRGYKVAFLQRRGRGRSEGLYDEGFLPDRSAYGCPAPVSLPAADRALNDIAAGMAALRLLPDVRHGPALLEGQSRGGILSVAFAGMYPDDVSGVLNVVGGWVGGGCHDAEIINPQLFARGGRYPNAMLWLYGLNDSFYSINHSRANHAAFMRAGGKGNFVAVLPIEGDGHFIQWWPQVWLGPVENYLNGL